MTDRPTTMQVDESTASDATAPSASSPFRPPVALTSLAGLKMVDAADAGFCGPDGCVPAAPTGDAVAD
ncbi:hypothetical protein [Georgenia subflava]|uniref:Uncharacterized protein n=1 Tax=Georgenia subflava TaxID=1622177 RepID=A0A6N7EGQ2_9MICO|nr:hypothetical protein [Georgenia subflava]MPV36148.1 hypothetical protein [Georgenia subflava]